MVSRSSKTRVPCTLKNKSKNALYYRPVHSVLVYSVYPVSQSHLKSPSMLTQDVCCPHTFWRHSSMSWSHAGPSQPSGHARHPRAASHTVLASRQLHRPEHSLPQVPTGQSGGRYILSIELVHKHMFKTVCETRVGLICNII